ncbi:division plane positioning ATPase MipZ, partial [Acinetobacter baumannii]
GKSTLAIHLACGLLHDSYTVAVIDLDTRQQSMARFFDNRRQWCAASGAVLPMPVEGLGDPASLQTLDETEARAGLESIVADAAAR